jgi:LysR family nitrogen assimilation transcriptional regulator
MELRQLRYFTAVARTGSLVAASRTVHVSQPALGYQIKQLETLLRVELFARHSRGVTLTDAGKAFFAEAEKVLAAVEQAAAAVAPYRSTLVGHFSFGVTPTSGRILLPDLLDICAAETKLDLSVREGLSNQLFDELTSGSLDLALGYYPPRRKAIEAVPLYREDLFLIGPPDLVAEHGVDIDFSELRAYPLILDDHFQVIRQLVERAASKKRVPLNIGLEMTPANVKRELIVRHRHATIVPYGAYLDEIRSGQVHARRIVNPALTRNLYFAFRRGFPEATRDFLLSAVRAIVDRVMAEHELAWKRVA